MRKQLTMLLLGTIAGSLCACSVLGERQESTKKDLDETSIKQMKVISKKKSGTSDDQEGQDTEASLDGKKIGYKSQYLQPNLDAEKYVADNKINFNQIKENEIKGVKYTMPGDVDRLSLFCGLGGRISKDLDRVQDPSDDYKAQIKYDEQAAKDIQAKLAEENPGCSNFGEVFGKGNADFKLDDVDLNKIAENTFDENGSMKDYLMKEAKKENPDVNSLLFKNLPKALIDQFTSSFQPDLNIVKISKHIQVYFPITCSSTPEKITAYVHEGSKFVPAESVKIDTEKKTVTIITRTTINKTDLAAMELNVGDQDKIKMGELKFGDKKISVMSNDTYEVLSTYELYMGDAPSESTESTTSAPKTESNEELKTESPEQPTQVIDTPEQPTQVIDASKNTEAKPDAKEPKGGSNTNPTATVDIKSKGKNYDPKQIPYNIKRPEQPIAANIPVKTKTTAVKPPVSAPTSIKSIPAVISAFPANANSSWFNMKLNGYAKNFYDSDGDYEPGDKNWEFWDDSKYNKISYTDASVNEACGKYTYARDLNFNVTITPPAEAKDKKYKKLLFDQYYVKDASGDRPSPIDEPIEQLVTASMNTPAGLKNQTWKIKLCFDNNGQYTAFLSSNDTRAASYTRGKDNSIKLNETKANHWLQVSKSADVYVAGKNPPPGFNPARKSRVPSMMSMICDAAGTNCTVNFQLKFMRDFEGSMMMAYINKGDFTDQIVFGIGSSADEIYNKIAKSFEKPNKKGGHKTNRNEIVVYGGFTLDPSKTGTAPATYISPTTLNASGKVPAGSYVPNVAAQILFPGESSELYLNVVANNG